MERLTVKDLDKVCYDPWELCGMDSYCTKDCHEEGGCTKGCEVLKIYKKLAEYEDLEEQGLLLKLPCKVGDKLYLVTPKEDILELTVNKFVYCAYPFPRVEIYFENSLGFETCLFDGTLNENVFLTQDEAEEALKRMGREE